ncbi:Rib/alpha-like domain-containing protein [Staphylococcus pseudintermedius]|nr:Rib/alpha-like domain-containing protein [Staphylococcus pseudintermedius]
MWFRHSWVRFPSTALYLKLAITIPDYPTDGDQPTITIDDPTQIPNGTEEGTVNVVVTVTYPDGSTDKLTVPVVTGKQADNRE